MKRRFQLNWGRGALLKIERLLEGGIDIDDPVDTFGYTLLHHAVDIGESAAISTRDESLAATSLLITKGANVNITDSCGRTPLILAISSFNVNVVKLLLDKDSLVNTSCKFGKTPLHYTIHNPSIELAELIVKKGGRLNNCDILEESPLGEASQYSNSELVEFLKKSGAEENRGVDNKVTPLHRSAFWGREREAGRLLLKSSNIESKDVLGNTPLIVAVRAGRLRLVKLLLDSGADVLAEDNSGDSVLHWACKHCLGDIVRLVLQHGASPLCVNASRQTPFDLAVSGTLTDCKVPPRRMLTVSPVINHLMDYGFCKRVDTALSEPPLQNHRRVERDALESISPLPRLLASNDLRRSFAGLPLSMSPFIREVQRSFLPNSLKKRWELTDLVKRNTNPQFYLDCKREIAIMKTVSLSDKLTLFDTIIKPVDRVIPYVNSETIDHLLIHGDCADDLPIYWGIVQASLEVLSYRKCLIESSQHLFTLIKPLLPLECVEIVLSYLAVKDLKALRTVSHKLELESLS